MQSRFSGAFGALFIGALVYWFAVAECSPFPNQAAQRTVNTDTSYKKWNRTLIPYYLDSNYSQKEAQVIRKAVAKITKDLNQCVTFREVTAQERSSGVKVKITPFQAAPHATLQEELCYSYPGKAVALAGAGEQRMSVARGPRGCLPADGKLRGVMKVLAVLLGKRNEHQRGDRDQFLTMHPENILLSTSYRLYSPSEAYWFQYPYDYSSITHNQPTDLAAAGKAAFTVRKSPYKISTDDKLSVSDCRLISMLYGCDPNRCSSVANTSTAAPAHAAVGASSATVPANATAAAAPHWGYEVHSDTDEIPPPNWAQVSASCGAARQSPINIDTHALSTSTPLRQLNMANYDELPIGEKWTVVNNGHSVQFSAVFQDTPRLQGGSLRADYDFVQFHFHWGSEDSRGSEHVVDGKSFPLELHMVHRKVNETDEASLADKTGLAVLGILFRVASANEEKPSYRKHLTAMVEAVKKVKTPLQPITVVIPKFDLDDLIPDIVQYYRYSGSLTTPPCAEVVQWSVLKDPLLITEEQLNVFRSLRNTEGAALEDNTRPVQNSNNRPVALYRG